MKSLAASQENDNNNISTDNNDIMRSISKVADDASHSKVHNNTYDTTGTEDTNDVMDSDDDLRDENSLTKDTPAN